MLFFRLFLGVLVFVGSIIQATIMRDKHELVSSTRSGIIWKMVDLDIYLLLSSQQ